MQVLTNTIANFKKLAYIVKQKLCLEKVNSLSVSSIVSGFAVSVLQYQC